MGVAGWRDDLRVPVWRPARVYDTAGVPGLQLVVGRIPRRDDGLGDDGRGRRRAGQGAPRSHGDASLLRLSHGRLFPALAEDAARALAYAARVSRQLVSQG